MKMTHKEGALLLTLLLSLTSCIRKNEAPKRPQQEETVDMTMMDMNMMDDEDMVADINDFFERGEALQEQEMTAWMEEEPADEPFKPLYFDYDRQKPKAGQNERLSFNVERAAELMAQAREEGRQATLIVEGHACSVGKASPAYKMALSQKRAQQVANAMVACGIDRQNIKVVGLGQEVPVLREGEPVAGSQEEQAPNRRCEFHILYS